MQIGIVLSHKAQHLVLQVLTMIVLRIISLVIMHTTRHYILSHMIHKALVEAQKIIIL